MTELDELEETDFCARHDGPVSARKIRAGKAGAARFRVLWQQKPKWLRQLQTAKATAARKKRKPEVTA